MCPAFPWGESSQALHLLKLWQMHVSCISTRCIFTDCACLVELYSTWIWTNNFFHWGQRHCWHFFLFSWTTRVISKHLKIIDTCDLHKKDHAIYRWRTASPLFFCDVGRVSITDKNTPSIASKCKIGSTCVGRCLCLELYRRCTLIWAHTTHRVHSVHLWETAFSHTWTNKLHNRSWNTPASEVRWTITQYHQLMVQVALRAFPQWMTVFVKSDNFGPYEYIMEDFNVIQSVRFHSTPNPIQKLLIPISRNQHEKYFRVTTDENAGPS